jgi:hypothetical protein
MHEQGAPGGRGLNNPQFPRGVSQLLAPGPGAGGSVDGHSDVQVPSGNRLDTQSCAEALKEKAMHTSTSNARTIVSPPVFVLCIILSED